MSLSHFLKCIFYCNSTYGEIQILYMHFTCSPAHDEAWGIKCENPNPPACLLWSPMTLPLPPYPTLLSTFVSYYINSSLCLLAFADFLLCSCIYVCMCAWMYVYTYFFCLQKAQEKMSQTINQTLCTEKLMASWHWGAWSYIWDAFWQQTQMGIEVETYFPNVSQPAP